MATQIDPNQFTTPFAITKSTHRDPYAAILPTNQSNSQSGKIIIITGSSAGLGEAAAKVWARAGASGIVIGARSIDALEKVAAELRIISPISKVITVRLDIANEGEVTNLYSQVQNTFGRSADVLLNVAGYLSDDETIGETEVEQWWKGIETNLKGTYSMTHHFIQSQPNPEKPIGTIITVSSGRAGLTTEGGSAYNINKLAEQRLMEHVQLENPTLRVFTTMPGISATAMVKDFWVPYALDHNDLTGMLALYLAQPRADYLKGSMVSVNWDVEELEEHAKEIAENGLLKTSWLPILPFNGGKGLGN